MSSGSNTKYLPINKCVFGCHNRRAAALARACSARTAAHLPPCTASGSVCQNSHLFLAKHLRNYQTNPLSGCQQAVRRTGLRSMPGAVRLGGCGRDNRSAHTAVRTPRRACHGVSIPAAARTQGGSQLTTRRNWNSWPALGRGGRNTVTGYGHGPGPGRLVFSETWARRAQLRTGAPRTHARGVLSSSFLPTAGHCNR